MSFSSGGNANMAGWWYVGKLARKITSSDHITRVCCVCKNAMNPAISPSACSICCNHYRNRCCYVYPTQRQRSARDTPICSARDAINGATLHENDSVRVVRRLHHNAAHQACGRHGMSSSSTSSRGQPQQPTPPPRPSVTGWW